MRSQHSSNRLFSLLAMMPLLMGFPLAAHASEFLFDSTGGTNLTSLFSPVAVGGNPLDDGAAVRSLGFSFTLFDLTRTGINVTTNGFLHLRAIGEGGNASPANAAFPTSGGVHRIAGAWDDLVINSRTSDSIVETKGTNYYAATYKVHKNSLGGGATRFQIALFGGDVTVDGYNFKAGDVAFSYGKMIGIPIGGTATIGLDGGNGLDFQIPSLPGVSSSGLVTDYSSLPLFAASGPVGSTVDSPFILFSPNASGGYDSSIGHINRLVAAAPEPTALLFMVLGGFLLGIVLLSCRGKTTQVRWLNGVSSCP